MEGRRLNRERVLASIQEVLERDDTEAWVRRLAPLGVVVAGVETLEQALASEHVSARGMVVEMATPHGPIRAVGNPIKFVDATERMTRAPLLDEHGKSA
jgi:crotonobetainyl-CoA:carnitine CoA-transferase CaiB-like acyl-CoA transferase